MRILQIILVLSYATCCNAQIQSISPSKITKGKAIPDSIYDKVDGWSENFARVVRGKKWGFINTAGKEAIPLQYQYADHFHFGKAVVQLNDKWGMIDTAGKILLPIQYDGIYGHTKEKAKVKLGERIFFIKIKR